MAYELPPLPYKYDSLEPFIDEKTMKIHHDKHHASYILKLNQTLKNYPELQDKPIESLIQGLEGVSEEIRESVKNNGGGHLNHTFFWSILTKKLIFKGEIFNEIDKTFQTFENFKEEFTKSAMNVFGSGWTWLVLDGNQLKILNTSGHENPITHGKIPLLVIDLWEHAYYLKYQNRKNEYIESFFNIINWKKVNELFLKYKI